MRPLLWLVLVFPACHDPIEEDLAGKLVRFEVISSSDDCSPLRFTGDAGTQFFGIREDGGVVFTIARQAKYGPRVDGGVLEEVERQLVPSLDATLPDYTCAGKYSNWERTDAGFDLFQEWGGADSCPGGPLWLPRAACSSKRSYLMTELGDCQLRCVQLTVTGEVTCSC